MHHIGLDRTLFLTRKVDTDVTRQRVQRAVGSCNKCQLIDPTSGMHEAGSIPMKNDWTQLALEVTHYWQGTYFSMIDCGPGRLDVWTEMKTGTTKEIARILRHSWSVALWNKLLMNNGTAFCSEVLEMLNQRCVNHFSRAAYRPNGNRIVERRHRTIKVIAERGHI